MIIKRFLVDNKISHVYINKHGLIDEEFSNSISSLKTGPNLALYADRYHSLITEYSEKFSNNKNSIIKDYNLAPATSSLDVGKISFDSLLQWDIDILIASQRMFIEVRCVNMSKFPIKEMPPWLSEIEEEDFLLLSGVRK